MDDNLHLPTADMLAALYGDSPLPALLVTPDLKVTWGNAAAQELLPALKTPPQPLSILLQRLLPTDVREQLGGGSPVSFPLPTLGRELILLPLESGFLGHLPPLGERTALADLRAKQGPTANESFCMNLNSIFASLLMLKYKSHLYEDPEAYQYLCSINESCFRLLRDERNLAYYTRLRTRREDYPLTPCDLTAHLQRLCAAIQLELGSRTGVQFRYSLPEQPVLVLANAELLDAALLNLLDNSLKYGFTEEEQQLRLRMQVGEQVRLYWSDNGPGAPTALTEKLYEPFFSLTTREGEPAGQGLGMTVAQEIVELHGGSMFTSTREDGGMEIAISLPLARPGGEALRLSSSAAARYNVNYFDRYSLLHVLLSGSIPPPMP